MADEPSKHEATPLLHLEVEYRDVPLAKLLQLQQTFLGLANEVAKEVADRPNAATWVVRDVKPGSIDFALMPIGAKETPRASLRTMVSAIVEGLRAIEQHARRPRYFSDRALEQAKALAQLRGAQLPRIEVRSDTSTASLTPALAANATEVLGRYLTELGRVEGRLEGVTLHQQRVFAIYDPLTDARIECSFGRRIPAEQVGQALEKRVSVYGEIHYRPSGEIISVKAEELFIFPGEGELPSATEVRGIAGKT